MSELREFDMLKYQNEEGDVYLDNLDIKDCIILGKQCRKIYVANCIFNNVIFDNYFQYCDVYLEESKLKNCEFHGVQRENCKFFEMI